MGSCRDPRLTYLNDSGYNVVRLPRKGIVPIGVIGRDGESKTWLGTLDQIWQSAIPVPTAGDPRPVAALSGEKTGDIKLSVGLDILANALSGMFGASAPSVDFAYRAVRYVQFSFRDVRAVAIDPFAIGNFLAKGVLKPSPVVKRFFTGQKDVEALVVSEVLEAKSIGVIGKRDASSEVSVDVPQIQAALGARVGVSAANAASTEIVYEGADFLAFGYKAFGIGMIGREWSIYGVAAAGGHAFAPGDHGLDGIVERDELVEIHYGEIRG